MTLDTSRYIQVGDFLRERCPKLVEKQHDIDLNLQNHPRLCRACGVKVCPHCWGSYSNFNNHLRQDCAEWKRSTYISRHTGHKANWDGDMRLSGRTCSGGLDS